MNTKQIISVAFLVSILSVTHAGPPTHEPYVGTAEFEQVKELAGTWRGTSSMDEGDKQVTVTYKVMSAGSAVVENVFPGTPHEMVSVYHDDQGKLSMTHYCALKNQPTLSLQKATKNTLDLNYSGGANIDPKKDAHMHSLSIEFVDDDHIVQNWAMYENGKKVDTTSITLSRVTD